MRRPGEEDGSLEVPLLPELSVGETPGQILNFWTLWGQKQDRGTASLWFIPLHLLREPRKFGASPDVRSESCLSGFAGRLMGLCLTENMFPNTLATGQTSPRRNFIFRRAF